MDTIKDRVKALCDSHGMTVAELEKALEFGNGTIAKWDSSKPRAKSLAAVAVYFGVPVESLKGDSIPEQKEIPIRFDPDEELKNAEKRGKYSYFIDLLDMSTPEAREEALALLISRLRNQ